jgi:hypothetical protein
MTKADLARLITRIEQLLDGPVRCRDCSRPLHNFRSIQLGRGPTCRRKPTQVVARDP